MLLHTNRTRTNGVVAVLALINGEIQNISAEVATAIGSKWSDKGGVWTGNQDYLIKNLSLAIHGYMFENNDHRQGNTLIRRVV